MDNDFNSVEFLDKHIYKQNERFNEHGCNFKIGNEEKCFEMYKPTLKQVNTSSSQNIATFQIGKDINNNNQPLKTALKQVPGNYVHKQTENTFGISGNVGAERIKPALKQVPSNHVHKQTERTFNISGDVNVERTKPALKQVPSSHIQTENTFQIGGDDDVFIKQNMVAKSTIITQPVNVGKVKCLSTNTSPRSSGEFCIPQYKLPSSSGEFSNSPFKLERTNVAKLSSAQKLIFSAPRRNYDFTYNKQQAKDALSEIKMELSPVNSTNSQNPFFIRASSDDKMNLYVDTSNDYTNHYNVNRRSMEIKYGRNDTGNMSSYETGNKPLKSNSLCSLMRSNSEPSIPLIERDGFSQRGHKKPDPMQVHRESYFKSVEECKQRKISQEDGRLCSQPYLRNSQVSPRQIQKLQVESQPVTSTNHAREKTSHDDYKHFHHSNVAITTSGPMIPSSSSVLNQQSQKIPTHAAGVKTDRSSDSESTSKHVSKDEKAVSNVFLLVDHPDETIFSNSPQTKSLPHSDYKSKFDSIYKYAGEPISSPDNTISAAPQSKSIPAGVPSDRFRSSPGSPYKYTGDTKVLHDETKHSMSPRINNYPAGIPSDQTKTPPESIHNFSDTTSLPDNMTYTISPKIKNFPAGIPSEHAGSIYGKKETMTSPDNTLLNLSPADITRDKSIEILSPKLNNNPAGVPSDRYRSPAQGVCDYASDTMSMVEEAFNNFSIHHNVIGGKPHHNKVNYIFLQEFVIIHNLLTSNMFGGKVLCLSVCLSVCLCVRMGVCVSMCGWTGGCVDRWTGGLSFYGCVCVVCFLVGDCMCTVSLYG